jgi:excisionase family DNA binding protein
MDNDELFTVKDAAEYLKVSARTVQRLIDTGDLKASKVGKFWRIKARDINAYLNKQSNKKG